MLKRILTGLCLLGGCLSVGAIDVNQASEADLDGIKGIGPSLSGQILIERKNGDFRSWQDLMKRLKGVGKTNAVKFSAQGLTVGSASFEPSAAAPSTEK